jgi:hypothetical protein
MRPSLALRSYEAISLRLRKRSTGLPVVRLSQLNPCIRSQAMPFFSSILAMARLQE